MACACFDANCRVGMASLALALLLCLSHAYVVVVGGLARAWTAELKGLSTLPDVACVNACALPVPNLPCTGATAVAPVTASARRFGLWPRWTLPDMMSAR